MYQVYQVHWSVEDLIIFFTVILFLFNGRSRGLLRYPLFVVFEASVFTTVIIMEFTFPFILCICFLNIVFFSSLVILFFINKKNHDRYWGFDERLLWNTSMPVVSPKVLLVFRVLACIWCSGIQISQDVHSHELAYRFFTVWNYTLLCVYFGLASLISIKGNFFPDPVSSFSSPRLSKLGGLVMVLFEIVFTMAFLVDAVLWFILLPMDIKSHDGVFRRERFINFWSLNQHAVNLVLMIVEFILNTIPVFRSHVFFMILWPTSYVVFAWGLHALSSTGFWPYPFMKTNVAIAPVWYVGLLLAHVVFYFIVYFLYRLKKRVCSFPSAADAGVSRELMDALH